MTRACLTVSIVLLLMLMINGCSGDDYQEIDNETPTDGDSTDGDDGTDGDAQEDGDQPDGDDSDGDESDGDETDGDDDSVNCTCNTTDACCDGCLPINNGGACEDGDPCTENDTCNFGVCETGSAKTCEATGPCEPSGACDPETGECVYETLADGTECEAMEGIRGSGLCITGECMGFGECDNRQYLQPPNYPCNFDSECESGICLEYGNGWATYCAVPCGEEEAPCPEGMGCVNMGTDMGKMCRPLTAESILPGDGSLDDFVVCNSNEDCSGGLCLSMNGIKFCTKDCESADGGSEDNSLCGPCGTCRDGGTALNFPFEYYCTGKGSNDVGDVCTWGFDCSSRYCQDGLCSNQCFDFGDMDTCPEGMDCITGIVAEDVGVCVGDRGLNKPFGESCLGDYECDTGLCRTIGGQARCVHDCTIEQCPEGVCTDLALSDVDTSLALYDQGPEAIDTDTSSGEGTFSMITYTFTQSGTYNVIVSGRGDKPVGYYHLTITDGSGDPAEMVEEENNDSIATANAVSYPVKILAYLSAEDEDVFSFEVTVDEELELTIETSAAMVSYCMPEDIVGLLAFGEPCVNDFECDGELSCNYGYCVETCDPEAEDNNCDGECYPDFDKNLAYCTTACETEADCPETFGCWDDLCVMPYRLARYPFMACRFDEDCDGESCIEGMCTDTCRTALDCEGGLPIPVQPYGACSPCDPNNFGYDCNAEGWGMNDCVTIAGASVCATWCPNGSGDCPVGTRCYSVSSFEEYCLPINGSCVVQSTCSEAGYCLSPKPDGSLCEEDAGCIGGVCANGMCHTEGCAEDEDCGCDLMACIGGYCGVAESAGVAEIEPNNEPGDAMNLDEFPVRIVATYNPVGVRPDVDVYSFSMSAGQVLDAITGAFCDQSMDTFIRLLDADGNAIEGRENDDINPNSGNFFSIVFDYVADSDQDLYIEISQSPYVNGTLKGYYTLDIDIVDVAVNTDCEGADTLEAGIYDLDFEGATNNYTGAACTGWGALGKDLAYRVEVPAGHLLTASINTPFDAQIYAVTDCADTEASCVAGADSIYEGGVESMFYANSGDEMQELFLIVDSFLFEGDTAFTLEIVMEPIETPANDTAAGAILIEESGTIAGSIIGATDDYNPGEAGCSEEELPGYDVVYSLELPADGFVSMDITADGFLPSMYLLTDVEDMASCLGHDKARLAYENESGLPMALYLIIDTNDPLAYGFFSLDVILDLLGECSGPCMPGEYALTCIAETEGEEDLCTCDEGSGTLLPFDCNVRCQENSALSGVCHVYTTPGREQNNCLCEYGCDNAQEQCEQMIYTNCTCSVSDPCGWQGDGSCDEFCAYEFPEDHFDDTEDCIEE